MGAPQFIFDTPEPVLIDMYVQQTLDELRKQGFQGDNVLIMAHSLGGVMSQIYLKKNSAFKALVLLGSGILRSSRSIDQDGKTRIDFLTPTLTIGGTKDGLFRITRVAEAYLHQNININE